MLLKEEVFPAMTKVQSMLNKPILKILHHLNLLLKIDSMMNCSGCHDKRSLKKAVNTSLHLQKSNQKENSRAQSCFAIIQVNIYMFNIPLTNAPDVDQQRIFGNKFISKALI